MEQEIWCAAWCDEESYSTVGYFKTQKDAFISCLVDWKYNYLAWLRNHYKELYKIKKKEMYRWHFLDQYHNLRRYHIYKIKIHESFLTREEVEEDVE